MWLLINASAHIAAYHETESTAFDLADFPAGWSLVEYGGSFPAHPILGASASPVSYTWDGEAPVPDMTIDPLASEKADVDGDRLANDVVLLAFAKVVIDEFNILRQQHGLADRDITQVKTAIKAKL
jgi:hypothetical protein